MGKRANNQAAAKAAAKKAKVDPAMAAVMDTVKKASHLPEQCSVMLANMLPFSLAVASDERLESQQKVVSMVEETLDTVKSEMETALAGDDAKLQELKATMADLVGTVKEAEATLATQKEVSQTKSASVDEATATETASSEKLAERQAAKAEADSKLASMQDDKVALEAAFATQFQAPMEAGAGPNFKELEPFLHSMDIEKSLHSTLPGTCAKSKETRGSFDDVILEQLEKAITGKISALGESIAAETSGISLLAEAVQEAEADFNGKKEARIAATAEFEAAQKEQSSGEEALVKANEAVTELCPQLEQTTAQSELTKSKLEVFMNGPLDGFMTFKTRVAAPIEAATAGA